MSLQLDSIFPDQSRRVVTYEQIRDLLNNLPKDLPEAFERALEEVIDDRYGGSIMKMVMAAPSPLSLDELRVALAVVPGDLVWYAAKVPTNASQLISLCGGNLLEVDEEDGKVRFIHYSVVNHLLQTTRNPRTMRYHFTSQEAEIQSGSICVTFLNMPIFETAVTMSRKIDGERLAEEVIGAATHEQPLLGRLAHLFKKTDRHESKSTDFDIGRLLAEIQAASMFKFDPHCFQDYAVTNWLPHSRVFQKENPSCTQIWHLWMRLLHGKIQVAKLPFPSPVEQSWPALSWALEYHHEALVYAIFEDPTTEPTDGERISQGIVELVLSTPSKTCDPCSLGLILVHLFQLAANILLAGPEFEGNHGIIGQTNASKPKVPWKLLFQSLQQLLGMGADPTIPHSRNGNNIIQMLLATLGCISETTIDGVQLCDLLSRTLTCDNTQPLLRSACVPYALRQILEQNNTQIFAKLLSYLPKLHLEPEGGSLIGVAVARGNVEAVRALVRLWPEGSPIPARASCTNGQAAIQLALEMQNKEMMIILAARGFLSHSTAVAEFSVPLLRIALERMSAEWVELLLKLGADPNLGYPALIEKPRPKKEFHYHLQIAAERNQTLKFLTLVRYGADPSLPAFPTISNIIRHTGNRILMARLEEINFFEPTKCSRLLDVGPRDGPPSSSALLKACKMLTLRRVNEDQILRYFGVAQSHHVGTQENRQELKLILLDLAKTTRSDRLGLQCPEGNTALHYLTGGMDNFHHEALAVASHLLASEWILVRHLLCLQNNSGQTPLKRAIDNGSRNFWRTPYADSAEFLLSHLRTESSLTDWISGGDNDSILGFSISTSAPFDKIIRVLLDAGIDPNGKFQGSTPLEIAVNMPAFHYASKVTACLLWFGADPSMKCSNRGSLLDVVATERRGWLRDLLRMRHPDLATMAQPNSSVLELSLTLEWTMRGTPIYELEDTSPSRVWYDKSQLRTPPPGHPAWMRDSRDSSPAMSDTSTRAVWDGWCGHASRRD